MFCLLVALLAPPAGAESFPRDFAARAVAIDGDTLAFSDAALAGERLRLERVRAPEMYDPPGPPARDFLAALIAGRVLTCRVTGRGKYGRLLGDCAAEGASVSEAMLAAGWALPYARGPKALKLIAAGARADGLGVWCVVAVGAR